MDRRLADLQHLFELERLEVNLFRGQSRATGSSQVFGGQVLGQAEQRGPAGGLLHRGQVLRRRGNRQGHRLPGGDLHRFAVVAYLHGGVRIGVVVQDVRRFVRSYGHP